MVLLDAYERKARLLPGLVMVLPIATAIVALGLKGQPVIAYAGGLLSALGIPVILTSAVRARGLALQEHLFTEWNGAPTTHALRLRGNVWPEAQRKQWRIAVQQSTNMRLASNATETTDSRGADGTYEAAVAALRTLTRDKKKFPFVAIENANYGYERNVLAMKPAGLVVTSVVLILLIISEYLQLSGRIPSLSALSIGIGIGITVATGAFWLFVPSKRRVWLVGRRYTERLMDAAFELSRGAP